MAVQLEDHGDYAVVVAVSEDGSVRAEVRFFPGQWRELVALAFELLRAAEWMYAEAEEKDKRELEKDTVHGRIRTAVRLLRPVVDGR